LTRATIIDAAPGQVEALLIGDSVLNGLAQPYTAAAGRHWRLVIRSSSTARLPAAITTSCRSSRIGAHECDHRAARLPDNTTEHWWLPPATTIRRAVNSVSARPSM
jgi:hypothetical protein